MGVRTLLRQAEEWWFDTSRGVRTAGDVRVPEASNVVGEIRDSQMYIPVRAANAHTALRDIPVVLSKNGLMDYTFVDMGSGKGRMLFVAAEYPFRKVIGVEFSVNLHEEAERNIQRYRSRKRRCGEIEDVLADAATFQFPEGKLVVYLFNPFGPEVMSRMLENLAASLRRNPRHVVLLLIWPECGDLVAAMSGAREVKKTRRHQVYEFGGS